MEKTLFAAMVAYGLIVATAIALPMRSRRVAVVALIAAAVLFAVEVGVYPFGISMRRHFVPLVPERYDASNSATPWEMREGLTETVMYLREIVPRAPADMSG